jgi:hypothetical protein
VGFDANDEKSDLCCVRCFSAHCQDRGHINVHDSIFSFLLLGSRGFLFSLQASSHASDFNLVRTFDFQIRADFFPPQVYAL